MTQKLELKKRNHQWYWSLVMVCAVLILMLQPVAAETLWDRFSTIMRDVYGNLVAISTIVGVTAAAVALLVRMISRNQRAVDEATSWLKRIIVKRRCVDETNPGLARTQWFCNDSQYLRVFGLHLEDFIRKCVDSKPGDAGRNRRTGDKGCSTLQ